VGAREGEGEGEREGDDLRHELGRSTVEVRAQKIVAWGRTLTIHRNQKSSEVAATHPGASQGNRQHHCTQRCPLEGSDQPPSRDAQGQELRSGGGLSVQSVRSWVHRTLYEVEEEIAAAGPGATVVRPVGTVEHYLMRPLGQWAEPRECVWELATPLCTPGGGQPKHLPSSAQGTAPVPFLGCTWGAPENLHTETGSRIGAGAGAGGLEVPPGALALPPSPVPASISSAQTGGSREL